MNKKGSNGVDISNSTMNTVRQNISNRNDAMLQRAAKAARIRADSSLPNLLNRN